MYLVSIQPRSDDSTPGKNGELSGSWLLKLLLRVEHQQHHKKQTTTEKIDNKEIL